MSRYPYTPPTARPAGEPFRNVAEAWFWCALGAIARRDGARLHAGHALVPRPCEPIDILHSVDRLYRNRMLLSDHLRVLTHYGSRALAPDPTWPKEARAARLWDEALARLEPVLRRKGIVA